MNGASPVLEHQRVREMFAPMVDHELAPGDEAALRHHLDGCADCKRGYEKYARAVDLVRGAEREEAPRDLAARVLKRVRKRRRGLFGFQGGHMLEQVSIPPVEAIIPILIAAVVAVLLILASQ